MQHGACEQSCKPGSLHFRAALLADWRTCLKLSSQMFAKINKHDDVVQEALRPRFLRRMKEDVETLPEKEEVVVWVELTAQQRVFYKGIYSGQVPALLGDAAWLNL